MAGQTDKVSSRGLGALRMRPTLRCGWLQSGGGSPNRCDIYCEEGRARCAVAEGAGEEARIDLKTLGWRSLIVWECELSGSRIFTSWNQLERWLKAGRGPAASGVSVSVFRHLCLGCRHKSLNQRGWMLVSRIDSRQRLKSAAQTVHTSTKVAHNKIAHG